MDLKTYAPRILNAGNVGCNHCIQTGSLGGIADFAHDFQLVVVDDDIKCQVRLYTAPAADARNTFQITEAERAGRPRTHVQLVDPEIDRVRPRAECRRQRLVRTRRSHQFKSGRLVIHEGQKQC